MPTNNSDEKKNGQSGKPISHEALVRQVAERVWELLREDLRREAERSGKRGVK